MTLEGVYLWNRVTIESNCKIVSSLLCDNVTVRRGVTIKKGCILSYGVRFVGFAFHMLEKKKTPVTITIGGDWSEHHFGAI